MKKSQYVTLLLLGLLVIGVTGGVWTSNEFIYKPSLGARGQTEKNSFDVGMDRVDNRLGKEIWVGDPNIGATLQDAITGIGPASVMLHLPAGTHSIAANLTIPVNVTLKPERGAMLSVADTKTLTVNGGFDPGLYQCVTCTGSGTVVFGNLVPKVYAEWFGAVSDNSTDCTAAFNLAANIARASACKRLAFPGGAHINDSGPSYRVSGQLDLTSLNIESNGMIYSTYAGTRVKLGSLGAGYSADRLDIKLNVNGTKDWTNANIINIWVSQTNYSTFDLSSANGTVGIMFEAGNSGCCYNTITLRQIQNHKIGFEVHVASGNNTGWANENLVLGGSWNNGANTGAECCIKLLGEGQQGITDWIFEKPSLEYTDGAAAIITTKASFCDFRDVRFECGAIPVALFNAGCVKNMVTLASSNQKPYTWSVDPSGTSASNCDVKMVADGPPHRLNNVTSFDAAYHDGTYLHFPGFQMFSYADSGIVAYRKQAPVGSTGLTDGNNGPALAKNTSSNNAVGLTVKFIDDTEHTLYAKKLYVKYGLAAAGDYGTLMVKCWDANGTILSGTSPAYVQGYRWSAGTNYYLLSYTSPMQTLCFHPNVATAMIGVISGGSAAIGCTGLEVYSPYQAAGYLSYPGPKELPGCLYAANAPTKWHFQVGEKVLNDAPATGAPQGWVCAKRTETTLTANGSGGDTAITVNSIAGIASGDVIGVKLNTGLYHFTTVNGAPTGSTVTLTAALPGSGVAANSGNSVVANLWKAMPNL